MDARMKCFECGRELPAMPAYLRRTGDVKMRCSGCADKHQAAMPIVPLELAAPDRKQITLHKPRPRRTGISDDALDALIGLPHAA